VYQPWTSTTAAPPRPLDRPVWVDLSILYGASDEVGAGDDRPPGGLLVATGRVPGLLKWWARAVDGRWFGKVNFAVSDAYGAIIAEQRDTLVPACALSPREIDPHR